MSDRRADREGMSKRQKRGVGGERESERERERERERDVQRERERERENLSISIYMAVLWHITHPNWLFLHCTEHALGKRS